MLSQPHPTRNRIGKDFIKGGDMKVFEGQMRKLEVEQDAENFSIENDQSLMDFKGSVILLVFWKTL